MHIKGAMAASILAKLKQAEDALYNKTITVTVRTIQSGQTPVTPPGHLQGPAIAYSSPGRPPAPAAAAGVTEVHVYLDSREVFRAVQTRAVRRQKRTGSNGLQRMTR